MRLFDEIVRTQLHSKKASESIYQYLNTTAREELVMIRNTYEEWFSRYPDKSSKTDISARFRSNNDLVHASAFFELMLHELLLKLNLIPEIHPDLLSSCSKHPDFFIKTERGNDFYLEAVTVSNLSNIEAAANACTNPVYDLINTIESSYFLQLSIEGQPQTQPSGQKIKEFVGKKLAELDYEQLCQAYEKDDWASIPEWTYQHDDWCIHLSPFPKSEEAIDIKELRSIGISATIKELKDWESLRKKIVKKASKYGKLDKPYIIAVNACSEFMDDETISESLFGDKKVAIDSINNTRLIYDPNGVWTCKSGIRYTHLSGVLVFWKLDSLSIPQAKVRLYHNPWALHPYNSQLTRLPQAKVVNGHIEKLDGEVLHNILKLPEEWVNLFL